MRLSIDKDENENMVFDLPLRSAFAIFKEYRMRLGQICKQVFTLPLGFSYICYNDVRFSSQSKDWMCWGGTV